MLDRTDDAAGTPRVEAKFSACVATGHDRIQVVGRLIVEPDGPGIRSTIIGPNGSIDFINPTVSFATVLDAWTATLT
jgi:hypothetical protein